jgi:sugar lactone lactonase YvrE
MKKILLFLLILALAVTVGAWIRYGGGQAYPNLSTPPVLGSDALDEVLSYSQPIGNVAVSSTGRIFFTVHPASRPTGNKLLEFVEGAAEPFPDGRSQAELFDTVLGVVIDRFDRLWTIDHGGYGLRGARLLAFDIHTGELLHKKTFGEDVAPLGSFLQDLQVSADGRTVVIADTSLWRKSPALIVYDVGTATARRILEGHPSVAAEDYIITSNDRAMTFAGGIVSLRGGVDGIALGEHWLYFGALSGASLYRVPFDELRDPSVPSSTIAERIERVAEKPLSDGMSLDRDGNVYITDVEHNAIFRLDDNGGLSTLVRSPRVRWPDALSFGPDGWLYVADSALSEVVLRPKEHIESSAPYKIFRVKLESKGTPGQ